jgi:hypothetical protein
MTASPLAAAARDPRWMDQPPPTRGHRVPTGGDRVLREQLKGRGLRLTDDQRRRLAAKGQRLGRRVLRPVAAIVQYLGHRASRHAVVEILQRALDAAVAPPGVVCGHLQNERREFLHDPGTAWPLPRERPLPCPGRDFSMRLARSGTPPPPGPPPGKRVARTWLRSAGFPYPLASPSAAARQATPALGADHRAVSGKSH